MCLGRSGLFAYGLSTDIFYHMLALLFLRTYCVPDSVILLSSRFGRSIVPYCIYTLLYLPHSIVLVALAPGVSIWLSFDYVPMTYALCVAYGLAPFVFRYSYY